jgi:undecaprenyl-diphosphatase
MDYFTVILLGILQGIAEFLPISSSGHLVIAGELLQGLGHSSANLTSIEVNVALHVGTLLSIVYVYRRHFRDVLRRPRLILAILLATLPLIPMGLFLKAEIDRLFETPLVAGCMLCVTAALMAAARHVERGDRTLDDLGPRDALLVGLFQAAAILPGLSRSGSTIFGGLLSGLRRDAAADFSFYIAVPAILGAAVLHARDLWEQGAGDVAPGPLLAGAVTSFVVGVCALKALLRLVTRQKLHWFAWYCGFVGLATIGWQLMS